MPQSFTEQRVVASLLDRLLDDEPRVAVETPSREGQVIREMRQSLQRDLMDLLNSRRPLQALPPGYKQLPTSLVNYGLPDLQSLEIREDHNILRLCRMIEDCIRTFEPRLHEVSVSPIESRRRDRETSRRFEFAIEAVLVTEAIRESVQYLSHVDSTNGNIHVEGAA